MYWSRRMKLKQQPGDFIVEEIPSITFSEEKNAQKIFLMEKQEIDTFEAVRLISKKTGLPLHEIGYAGLKDKHALAKQYISLPSHVNIQELKTANVRLRFVGYHSKKIQIGDLQGNRFQIIVRDIQPDELPGIQKRGQNLPHSGIPNYFDSQRFGSVFRGEFIAKFVVKKNYEPAVKLYLTSYLKSEKKMVKDEKRLILAHWNTLGSISVRKKEFALVITEYLTAGSWLAAYKKIPASLREMYVNAYQSFLWNESVKEILHTCVDETRLYPIPYHLGSLVFYTGLNAEEVRYLPSVFPTLSETVLLSDSQHQIVDKVLLREKITLQDFAIEEDTGNFFKTRSRPVLVKPEHFVLSDSVPDEVNDALGKPRFKMSVSFELPQGCYATLITKRLFGH